MLRECSLQDGQSSFWRLLGCDHLNVNELHICSHLDRSSRAMLLFCNDLSCVVFRETILFLKQSNATDIDWKENAVFSTKPGTWKSTHQCHHDTHWSYVTNRPLTVALQKLLEPSGRKLCRTSINQGPLGRADPYLCLQAWISPLPRQVQLSPSWAEKEQDPLTPELMFAQFSIMQYFMVSIFRLLK